ncbi:MAG: PEP-CTERM sorting domain-containing protein [Acidobacteria bacterium]|nr:PEP-CTERM sorting domain-containing protein [Acidobacteriota bacterium]
MFRKSIPLALALLCMALIAAPASAAVIVPWTGGSDFDDESIFFTGFTADSLTAITPAFGYFHDHGNAPTTFYLQIELNSVWTTIGSYSTPPDNADHTLDNIAGPYAVSFTPGTVTGLRLYSDPGVSWAFHGMSTDTSFTFDSKVPEPSTYALLGAGLGLLALLRRRVS